MEENAAPVAIAALPAPVEAAAYYLVATLFLAGLYVMRSGLGRVYSIKWLLDPKEQLRRVFRHWNAAFSVFVLALFLTHATDFYSRGSILVQYGCGLAVVIAMRFLLRGAVARGLEAGTLEGKNVAVVGAAGMVNDTIRRFLLQRLRLERMPT